MTVSGIGENRRHTLISNGIVTASEIREASLLGLPGFGAGMVSKLMDWRRRCEVGFRFDSTAPMPAMYMQKLSETMGRSLTQLMVEGAAVESEFGALKSEYETKFNVLQSEYEDLCKRRAVLESKISALEKRRP
jgi:DNA-binding helix-hairpin-helix protein with protein kinase domain